jgi:DNA topoisomerase-2
VYRVFFDPLSSRVFFDPLSSRVFFDPLSSRVFFDPLSSRVFFDPLSSRVFSPILNRYYHINTESAIIHQKPVMSVDKALSKIFKHVDAKSHAKKKTMWGGSFEPSTHHEYIENENGQYRLTKVRYAASLFKCFDEILVNCVDAFVKNNSNRLKRYKVKSIVITYDRDTGYITIFNDGNGIPIGRVKDKDGNIVLVPQLISTEFFAGSNNDEDSGRITGGVNGVGLSMVNNNSEHFILKTTDIPRKKHFSQESHNRMSVIDKASVCSVTSMPVDDPHKVGGTTVSFLPDYGIYKFDLTKDFDDLNNVFRARALQVAMHTGLSVTYNGEKLTSNMSDFASKFMSDGEFTCMTLKHPQYNWDVSIGLSTTGTFESLTVINGVCVKSGKHVRWIQDQVVTGLKSRLERLLKKYKAYKRNMLVNNMFIIISGNIPSPDFTSQNKTEIGGSVEKYKLYNIGKSAMTSIWKVFEPRMCELFLSSESKTTKKSTSNVKKYKRATKSGKKRHSANCTLIVCEGDSAESMVDTALRSSKVDMTYEYYGTFNIGGVPMNSRTKSVLKIVKGKRVIHREKKLVDNERLSSFERVTNLDHSLSYKTAEERSSLYYGHVVAAVDQDLDGIGQILGLLGSHIHRFWPALIEHGWFQHLETPILRAFPPRGSKASVISFYTDDEYRKWATTTKSADKWTIKYYKGLATHNNKEAIHMFQHFSKSIITMTLDKEAHKSFDIYYGNNPNLRKKELVEPPMDVQVETPDGKHVRSISCTSHLKSHTKEFQLDNLKRKLPHVYDGLNPSRRKALCASIKKFMSNNSEIKVFQLAGYIAEQMAYHHGSASLENTIINMCQMFVGANNIPLLLPMSQFGSRGMGGKNAGAPRYIKTKLNRDFVKAMYPSEDTPVLVHTKDEGEYNEPEYYVPVMPMAILESLELPATGWKYEGYARDWTVVYTRVVQCIVKYISGNVLRDIRVSDIEPMPFWKGRWTGEVREVSGHEWSVGDYTYDEHSNTVTVTELPFQVWNENYVTKMSAKPLINKVTDKSTINNIVIVIELKDGALSSMDSKHGKNNPEFDVIEDYCCLKEKMGSHLNYMKDGTAYPCDDYRTAFVAWFIERFNTYVKRYARLRTLTHLRIEYLKAVTRFVAEHTKYKFSEIDENTAEMQMLAAGYPRFNKTLLDSPGLTHVGDLASLIMDTSGDAKSADMSINYNYLFNIGPRQRMTTARKRRAKALADSEAILKKVSARNVVSTSWLCELATVNSMVEKAASSENSWLYGERVMKFK